MLQIKGTIPHPQLFHFWESSKYITTFISIFFMLLNIILCKISRYNVAIYSGIVFDIDLINIIIVIFYKTIIANRINTKKIYYRKNYENIKFIIYVLNYFIFGAFLRAIINIGYLIVQHIYVIKFDLNKIVILSNLNFKYYFILFMFNTLILLYISYILFYKNKYISVYEYSLKIKNSFKSKYTGMTFHERKNYLEEMNYLLLNKVNLEQNKYEIFKKNNNMILNEKNSIKKCIKDNIEKDKNDYEAIPAYGIYVSKEGKTFINGREVDVFK